MEKELKDIASMQRRRLKQVIDPMRSIMAIEHTGYRQYLSNTASEHARYQKDGKVHIRHAPWLLASCVPLAYLTKSLWLPTTYFMLGLSYLLYNSLINQDCFFCRPTLRSLTPIDQ